jgi:hypothetical protein
MIYHITKARLLCQAVSGFILYANYIIYDFDNLPAKLDPQYTVTDVLRYFSMGSL